MQIQCRASGPLALRWAGRGGLEYHHEMQAADRQVGILSPALSLGRRGRPERWSAQEPNGFLNSTENSEEPAVSNNQKTDICCSLSSGERVRVRARASQFSPLTYIHFVYSIGNSEEP